MTNEINLKSKNAPFEIRFLNINEIRMGSPYNSCEIELIDASKTKLPLPMASWQDKYAWSADFKHLILVKWNMDNNIPGFNFFILDTETSRSWESKKILGLLNELLVEEKTIKFNKFLYDKKKSNNNQLCCNIDEKYDFLIR